VLNHSISLTLLMLYQTRSKRLLLMLLLTVATLSSTLLVYSKLLKLLVLTKQVLVGR